MVMTRVKVCWAVKYADDCWVAQLEPLRGSHNKTHRLLFMSQNEAYRAAAEIVYPVTLVKVRRKPKATPPLKVGDEVLVRCRVVHAHHVTNLEVEEIADPVGSIIIDAKNIVREKAT